MLLVEKSDQIAVVTLNRPEAMNAMSKAMRSELYRAMTALNEDDEVSVVILTGAGELMAVARKLAADMATIPVETLSLYKRIIDEGFALPYGQSLAHEHAHSSAHNRTVTPEAVEARRAAIQARARTQ